LYRKPLPLVLIVVISAGCGGDTGTESHRGSPAPAGNSATADSPTMAEAAKERTTASGIEELQPIEIVNAYFKLLREGRGPEAIHAYWDTQLHAQRLFGEDFDALSAEDQARVARELERCLIGIYANPATAAVMKRVHITNVTESRDGDSCTVRFDAGLDPRQPTKPQEMLFVNHDGRWRLADMRTPDGKDLLSRAVNRSYKSTGTTPLEYARAMTKELPSINEMIDRSEEAKNAQHAP
jgi:hypothetical protein